MVTGWIDITKICTSLAGFNKKKLPGPDGFKPIIFEHLPPNGIEALLHIYKACIALAYTPALWKDTKVIFLSGQSGA